MCTNVVGFLNMTNSSVTMPLCNAVSGVINTVAKGCGYFGRAACGLDQYIGEQAALTEPSTMVHVARSVVRAAPYAIIGVVLPKSLSLCSYAGIVVYKLVSGPFTGCGAIADVVHGVALSALLNGAIDLQKGVRDAKPMQMAYGMFEMVGSGYMLSMLK